MKPASRRFRWHPQRGSIGPQPSEPLPQLMQRLEELERRLSILKTGLSNLTQLQQLEAEADFERQGRQDFGESITQLQQAVDEFELELATRTISWPQVRETFWQAVRFGGLGIVIGWGLAWLVMRNG